MIKGIDAISPISLQNGVEQVANIENGSDFFSILKESLNEVNDIQIKGDEALKNIATGQVKDLHSAAIAIDKAEISMKVMLEVRNKALNAYKEILKTPM
jgi:flagellar hook-basal body complex protein FliE